MDIFFDMEGQLCLYSDGNCQARVSQISREQQQLQKSSQWRRKYYGGR